jgi:hypothetical protein
LTTWQLHKPLAGTGGLLIPDISGLRAVRILKSEDQPADRERQMARLETKGLIPGTGKAPVSPPPPKPTPDPPKK